MIIDNTYNRKDYSENNDLKNYLDDLFSENIEATDCIKNFDTNEFVKNGMQSQSYSNLYDCSGKTGIYIFFNKDNVPVYIGVGGEKNGKQDLKKRLTQHFPDTSHLAKNIRETEKVLGYEKQVEHLTSKEIMLKYAPKFLIVIIGNLVEPHNCQKSQKLEKILIALWNSRYNR